MRQKWDDRRGKTTYGQRTIDKAIRQCTETYGGPRAGVGTNGQADGRVGGSDDVPNDPVHLTDRGNAIRLVRGRGKELRHVHPWHKWLVWDGVRWRADDRGMATHYAKSMLVALYRWAVGKADEVGKALEKYVEEEPSHEDEG
jgi:putative DNA primase/helicase